MPSLCLACWRNVPAWHDLLVYQTAKRVKIKDPWLGFVRILLILGCTLYFVIYRLWFEAAYYEMEQVAGQIQTSLMQPSSWDGSSRPGLDAAPYCTAFGDYPGKAMTVLPCVTGPAAWVAAPSSGGSELFIATRITDPTKAQPHQFVLLPEDYILGVSFVAQALQHYHISKDPRFSKSSGDLSTELVDRSGRVVSNGLTRVGRSDVMKVGTLLQAAGVSSLDRPHAASTNSSNRHQGMILVVKIECDMVLSGTIEKCRYKADMIAQSVAEMQLVTDFNLKTSQARRGILISFQFLGQMGRFHWPTLILAWVSALALVEICTFIIDWCLAYVLPYRGIYRMVLYDDTPNIHKLRKGDKKAQRGVKNLRLRHLAIAGEVNLVSRSAAAAVDGAAGEGKASPLGGGSLASSARPSPRAADPPGWSPAGAQDRLTPGSSSAYQASPAGGGAAHQQQGGEPALAGLYLPQQQHQATGSSSPVSVDVDFSSEAQQLPLDAQSGGYRSRAPTAISTTEEGPESELL